MKESNLTKVKTELRKFDKEKLVDLIAELYRKHKPVKDFFDFYVQPDEQALFQKYKDKVEEAFFPKRGFQFKLKDARHAISEFKKYEPSTILVADLMLFYVKCGVKFTNEYGDIDERFYTSMEKMFEQALSLMSKENLLGEFQKRAEQVLLDADRTGWGFPDTLNDIYSDFYDVE